jgi:thiol:disulfide interchange protein DsbA
MKINFKTTLATLALTITTLTSFAQEFIGLVEGKDYIKSKISETVINTSQTKPGVVEFFWYGCGHCYKMKPLAAKLFSKYNGKIVAEQYPVAFPSWESGTRMFFAYQEMGILNKMHDKTFDEIHKNNKNILSDNKVRDIFLTQNGVDVAKFNSSYNSFNMTRNLLKAKNIVDRHKISGSPIYAVYSGGYTYQVSPVTAGGYERTIDVLDKILQQKLK